MIKRAFAFFLFVSLFLLSACGLNRFPAMKDAPEGSGFVLPKLGTEQKSNVKASTNYVIKFVSSDISEYPKIKLYYKIYDLNGNVVNDFDIKHAYIKEKLSGGEYLLREVKIHENLLTRYGLNTSLAIDKSGSVKEEDMAKIKTVLSAFIDKLNFSVGDKAELITFTQDIFTSCPYTNDKNELKDAIMAIRRGGDTALYDAMHSGISHSSMQGGARCVIAFTDGKDNRSKYTDDDVINFSLKQQVPVYIIGVANAEENKLKNIAERTGGKYWYIDDLNDMETIFNEIYGMEKSTYYIEYVTDISGNEKYSVRTIDLLVDNGDESMSTTNEVVPVKPSKIGHDETISFEKRLRDMYTVKDYPTDTNVEDLDSISFGHYEQDNNLGNGKEGIEWIILKKENGHAMLMSKYVLDCQQYNNVKTEMYWAISSLRSWLNNVFYNEAFDSNEKALIPQVTVVNEGNMKWQLSASEDTYDYVYLLSERECVEFFGEPNSTNQIVELSTNATDYAKSLGVYVEKEPGQWYNGNSTFWLRSPGNLKNRAGNVTYCGYFYQDGNSVDFKLNGIRPIIWVRYE